jgi:hypothetical protein
VGVYPAKSYDDLLKFGGCKQTHILLKEPQVQTSAMHLPVLWWKCAKTGNIQVEVKKVNLLYLPLNSGAWGGVVVKALRYYSEGPGIDPRLLGIFSGGIGLFHVPWGRLSL